MKELQPLRSILYESTGTGSFARTASMLIVVVPLIWVSWVVFKTGQIPDLTNVISFIGILGGMFYGINRGTAPLQPKEPAKEPTPNG